MEFDTVAVPEDTHRTISVGTDEIYENVLIDITRSGASATIETRGTGWRIRNVGLRGVQSADQPAFRVADSGGRISRLVGVYLGDGAAHGTSVPAVEVKHSHTGRLWLFDTAAVGWTDCGFASDETAHTSGTVRYERCYSANAHGANFQTGSDTLIGCVAASHGQGGRGLWATGDTDCDDCTFHTGGENYAIHAGGAGETATVTAANSAYDNSYRGGLRAKGDSAIDLANVRGGIVAPSWPDSAPASAVHAAAGELAGATKTALSISTEQIEIQDSHWQTTDQQTLDSPSVFSDSVGGLNPNADYDFQAVAEGDDGESTSEGESTTFSTVAEDEAGPVNYTISNVYLSGIDGPAIHIASDTEGAEVVIENVHIEDCPTGVLADGVTVTVRDCEIAADEPLATTNGGSITDENTNTGSDASPSTPSGVPGSPEEAAGSNSNVQ